MADKKNKDTFEKWLETGELDNNLAVIQSLAMQGQSMDQIAKVFKISRRTLMYLQSKHPVLKKAIDRGRLTVVAMCQNKLMEKVNSGDTTAIIYALKIYGGDFFNDRKFDYRNINATNVQPKVQIYLPATDTRVISNGEEKN